MITLPYARQHRGAHEVSSLNFELIHFRDEREEEKSAKSSIAVQQISDSPIVESPAMLGMSYLSRTREKRSYLPSLGF
jgi:hypothetical protein